MSDNPACSEACRRPVECARCHRTKAPYGRSIALAAAGGYCDSDCPGYSEYPQAGHLLPSETIGSETEPDDEAGP